MNWKGVLQMQERPSTHEGVLFDPPIVIFVFLCLVCAWPSVLLGGLVMGVGRLLIPPQWRWHYWGGLFLSVLLGGWVLAAWLSPPILTQITSLWQALLAQQTGELWSRLFLLWGESLWLSPAQALLFSVFVPLGASERLLAQEQARQAKKERARDRANTLVAQMPDALDGEMVVGVALDGDLDWQRGDWCVCPARHFGQASFVLGEGGSGKTETVLRLSYGAAKVARRQVLYVDAKGDPKTAIRFVAAMRAAGIPYQRIRVFPYQGYDGWRGGQQAQLNRLISVHHFTEEFYGDVALRILELALRARSTPVQSSTTLLRRLYRETLESLYVNRPESQEIEEITMSEVKGTRYRFQSFFSPLQGKLDGTWAFDDDIDAAYILIPGLALKREAAALGRFFIEELASYVGERKPADRDVFIVFDELSALNLGMEIDPSGLFERLRSFGAGIVGTSQSPEGVGLSAERMLDASTLRIIHRLSDPQRLVQRAGTRQEIEATERVEADTITGAGTLRLKEAGSIHPDDVRRLREGFAMFTCGGRGREVRVGAVPVTEQSYQEAEAWLATQAAGGTIPAP
jgi:hypothetical protein